MTGVLLNVLTVIFIIIAILLAIAGLSFFVLLADIHLQYCRILKLKKQLTIEEIRVLEIHQAINNFIVVVDLCSEELHKKELLLKDMK